MDQFFIANVVMKMREEQTKVFSAFCRHSEVHNVVCILLSFWSAQSMVNGAVCSFLVLGVGTKMDGPTAHRPSKVTLKTGFWLLAKLYHCENHIMALFWILQNVFQTSFFRCLWPWILLPLSNIQYLSEKKTGLATKSTHPRHIFHSL